MLKQGVLSGISPSGVLQARLTTYDKAEGGNPVTSDCFQCNVTLTGVDGKPNKLGLFAVLAPNQTSVTISIEYKGNRLGYVILRDDGSFEWYNLKRSNDYGKA